MYDEEITFTVTPKDVITADKERERRAQRHLAALCPAYQALKREGYPVRTVGALSTFFLRGVDTVPGFGKQNRVCIMLNSEFLTNAISKWDRGKPFSLGVYTLHPLTEEI